MVSRRQIGIEPQGQLEFFDGALNLFCPEQRNAKMPGHFPAGSKEPPASRLIKGEGLAVSIQSEAVRAYIDRGFQLSKEGKWQETSLDLHPVSQRR
jgi:hypothetical protein